MTGMAPVVIEARGLEKSFRVPEHRMDSFKERATHPFARPHYRVLQALSGLSFDVHEGEFFGILGRNGSGKSTLLKILASIYRADAGTIRMAGRLAPFIELGVGFDPELTGRENAVLNGVLMGLSRREAQSRIDAVLEFAELERFDELKLKNYSSGMMVRLAFAVMVQADADIMLIDEVLAVGDAAFAQKCMDVFHERRRAGKTIMLVTHDMESVQSLCDRAMLIHDGEMRFIGDPEEAARQYYRLNFVDSVRTDDGQVRTARADLNVRVLHAHVADELGEPTGEVGQEQPIRLDVLLEARRDLTMPTFTLHARNAEGTVVFGLTRELQADVPTGRNVRIAGTIENALVPGSYSLDCWVRGESDKGDYAVQGIQLMDFHVHGAPASSGVISVRADIDAVAEPGPVR